ncbi:hypothetical protein HYH02_012512 [Chlamydomonas schloesseri]|uniref:Uncharacterized protein n=1 Tax=Chlamydomonas schloesseri TaxID=2026947 RepID=A0A835T8L8_9CHLO|nr:hypothetical protein HYH02_012512 [Chlamydomonas schloesseri]|eukprot:KAG2433580.1 hypothetical protein HYH02_012512 [Chlamydomonas schloesseri]
MADEVATSVPAEATTGPSAASEPASQSDVASEAADLAAAGDPEPGTAPEHASSTSVTASPDADAPGEASRTGAGAGDSAAGDGAGGGTAVTVTEPAAEAAPPAPAVAAPSEAAEAAGASPGDDSTPAGAATSAAAVAQEAKAAAAAADVAAGPENATDGDAPGQQEAQQQQQQQQPHAPPAADPHAAAESASDKRLRSLPPPQRHGLAAAGLHAARGRWMRAKHAVATIFRASMLVATDKSDFEKENMTALVKAQVGASDVALEVENHRDLAAINYAKQGNAEMYTEDALLARRAVRTHPAVVEAVRAWWRWLPKSATRVVVLGQADEEAEAEAEPAQAAQADAAAAGAAATAGGDSDGSGGSSGSSSRRASKADPDDVFAATLDCPIYSAMVVAITLVLLPRFGLPTDPDYDPAEDWVDDNKGLPYMDFPNFFDAMFELADMWSDNVDGPEYAELLESLFRDVQALEARQGLFSALLKKFGHKPPEPQPAQPSSATSPATEPGSEPPARAPGSLSPSPAPAQPKPAARKPEPKAAPAHEPVKSGKPTEPTQPKPAQAAPSPSPAPPLEGPAKSASPRGRSPARVPARQQPPASLPARAPPSPRTVAVAGRRESSMELPDYDAADYSGVESTLGAYMRQQPPSPQRMRGPSEPQRRHVDIPMSEWDRPGFNPGPGFQQLSPRGAHFQNLTDGGAHLRAAGWAGGGGGGGGGGYGGPHEGAAWHGGFGDWHGGAAGMAPGADALSGAVVRGVAIRRGGGGPDGGGRSWGLPHQPYQHQPYHYPGVAYGGTGSGGDGGGGGGWLEGSHSAYQLSGGGGGSGSGMGQAQLGLAGGGGPHGGAPGTLYAEYMESVIAKRLRQSPQRAGGGGGGVGSGGTPSPPHQHHHHYGYTAGRGRMSDPGRPAAGSGAPDRGGGGTDVAVVGAAALQGGGGSLLEVRPSTAGESDSRSPQPTGSGAGAGFNGPRASGAGFLPRLPSGQMLGTGSGASSVSALAAAAAAHLPTINDQAGPGLVPTNGFTGYANSPAGPASPTRTAASGALSPTRRGNPLGFWSYDASTGANGNGNGGINAAAVMLPNLSMDPRLAGFYSGAGARSIEQQRRWRGSGMPGGGRGAVTVTAAAAAAGAAGSGGGSSQSNSPLPQQQQPSNGPHVVLGAQQQPRDLVKASRQQVNLMAQALVAQQQAEQQIKRQQQQAGLLQPRGGGGGGGSPVAAPAAPAGVIPAMTGTAHTSGGFGAGFGGNISIGNSSSNSMMDGIKPPVNGQQKRMAAGGSFQSYVLAGKGAVRADTAAAAETEAVRACDQAYRDSGYGAGGGWVPAASWAASWAACCIASNAPDRGAAAEAAALAGCKKLAAEAGLAGWTAAQPCGIVLPHQVSRYNDYHFTDGGATGFWGCQYFLT